MMRTERIISAQLDRVVAAFGAVRDSINLLPIHSIAEVRTTSGTTVTHLSGSDGQNRVDAELFDEGPAGTRVRLRMTYPLPFERTTPMLHQRWAFKAVEHLGSDTHALVVPERIWPEHLSTCVGLGDFDVSSAGATPPVPTVRIEPVYASEARRLGLEGRVYVQIALDATGAVTCAMVTSGMPGGLSESALDAARQWRFRPAIRGGQSFAALVTVPFAFRVSQ